MAGGAGTRFWPASREDHPKQFIDILGTGQTLLQHTYERFTKLCSKKNIYFITNAKYEKIILEQIPGVKPEQIIKEPSRRNTAPCVAYAANKIHQINNKANLIIAPSDHYIKKESQFINLTKKALKASQKHEALITLGIQPDRPDTGYGYIQYDRSSPVESEIYNVKMFTEKPNQEMAKKFLRSGEFLWNSGIFIWKTSVILDAFKALLPEMYDIFNDDTNKVYNSKKESAFIQKAYSQCKNISIDYGIMEKASTVLVLPGDFGWSDLGTWNSVYAKVSKDKNKNVIQSKMSLLKETKNCMIKTNKDKLVVIEGLEDFIVVDDKDVLLIIPRKGEQNIKNILTSIREKKGTRFL
jgi:mannose-1-phosphate guanylyltransferase